MSNRVTTWMNRFWKDLKKKEFIAIKVLFFLIYGGMTTLFPFLTIQARGLGISADELGIIYSLLPVIGVFAPALAGMFADKLGNFKIFLSTMVSLSGFASLLFLVIPQGRVVHKLPEQLPLTLNFTRFDSSFQILEPLKCDISNINKIEINVTRCQFTCSNTFVPMINIYHLDETWCSVTENCDMFKNISAPNAMEENNNSSNKPVSFDVDVVHKEFKSDLRMPDQFSPDIQKVIDANSYLQIEKTANDCWLQCDITTESETLCSNINYVEDVNSGLTMILYTIIRLLNSLTLASSIPLFEGATVAILSEHKGDFGFQRMYGNLGMLVLTPISGKLIDFISNLTGKEDFRPAFYMYCCLKLMAASIIFFINLEFKKPSNSVVKDVKSLIVDPRVTCFLVFTLISGTCWGFVDTFLFWLLEDMNADKSLMGLTVTVGAIFGIPLLMCSTYIIKRLGYVGTLSLSMAIYIIRLSGYSLIQNPWMAMPFEALESFTNSLMGVASVSYTAILSTPSTTASLQGIYGGLYNGVGRGVGSLIGGFLIKIIGIRSVFQVLALSSAVTSVAYFLTHWFIFRKIERKENEKDYYSKVETGEDISDFKDLKIIKRENDQSNKGVHEIEKFIKETNHA